MIVTEFHTKVHVFHFDNGHKFVNQSPTDFFKMHDILHQTTYAYMSQQNGIAKHKNHHFLDVVRALYFTIHVPKHFWADTIMIIAYLIN